MKNEEVENEPVLSARHMQSRRVFPVGAEVLPRGGVHFRVWAPRCRTLRLVLEPIGAASSGGPEISIELERERPGYFSGYSAEAKSGQHYRFRLDERRQLLPDPLPGFSPRDHMELLRSWTQQSSPGRMINGKAFPSRNG